MYNDLPDALILADPDGTIVFANTRAGSMFGYPAGELTGQPLVLLFPAYPRGHSWPTASDSAPNSAVYLNLGRRQNGEEFPVEISLSILADTPARSIILIRDVTARLQADGQLRLQSLALEASANGIVITDRSGQITWVNPAFTALTGYPLEEVIGQNPRLLKSDLHDAAFYQRLWETVLAGRVWHGELQNRRKDGSLYIEEQTITPVRDSLGRVTHFIAIKQDVTARRQAEEALRRQNGYLAALHEGTLGLLSRRELHALLEDIVRRAGELVGTTAGYLDLVDAQTGELRPAVAIGALSESLKFPVTAGEGLAGQVWQSGQPLVIQNYDDWPGRVSGFPRGLIRTIVGVPLKQEARVVGVLGLAYESGSRRTFGEAELELLTRFAQLAAVTIDYARLYQNAIRVAEQRTTLQRAGQALNASLNVEQVCAAVHQAVGELLPEGDLLIALLDDVRQELEAVYVVEAGQGRPGGGERLPTRLGLSGRVVSSGQTLRLDEVSREEALADSDDSAAPIRSILAVPLRQQGRVIGLISATSPQPRAYTAEHQELLELLGVHAAVALANARLFTQMRLLATTDSLTRQSNRRRFFEMAGHEFERARRYPHPLSIIMLDIDHFKLFNDMHGHSVGDQVLVAVAERCRRNLREVDVLGRYGGEEFAILLAETDLEQARQVAERLRTQMAQIPIVYTSGGPLRLTISLGVAGLSEACADVEMLLMWADQALYMAKRGGRNRVEIWESNGHSTP